MEEHIITPEEQRLVIERLHRSDDSLTATERFNQRHGETMGHHLGKENMELHHFGRLMNQALTNMHHSDPHYFTRANIQDITHEITGKSIDLNQL